MLHRRRKQFHQKFKIGLVGTEEFQPQWMSHERKRLKFRILGSLPARRGAADRRSSAAPPATSQGAESGGGIGGRRGVVHRLVDAGAVRTEEVGRQQHDMPPSRGTGRQVHERRTRRGDQRTDARTSVPLSALPRESRERAARAAASHGSRSENVPACCVSRAIPRRDCRSRFATSGELTFRFGAARRRLRTARLPASGVQ